MGKLYISDTLQLQIRLNWINRAVNHRVDADDVLRAVIAAQKDLKRFGVRKADWQSVRIVVNPARNRKPSVSSPSNNIATEVVLAKDGIGWYLSSGKIKRALQDTPENRRNYFIHAPADTTDVKRVLESVGFITD